MSEKTIEGWLIVDWKNGGHRTRKSKPSSSDLGANELPARLEIDVTVPEVETPTLALEIDVPEPQVHAAELSALPEDEQPAWTQVVDEKIEANTEALDATDESHEITSIVKEIVTDAMIDAPGRPEAERVEQYVHEQIMERAGVSDE